MSAGRVVEAEGKRCGLVILDRAGIIISRGEGDTLSEYMLSMRKKFGWSQETLAERANLSVRTIRNLETGVIINPRPSTVELLTKAFFPGGGMTGITSMGISGLIPRSRPAGHRDDDSEVSGMPPPPPAVRWPGFQRNPPPLIGRTDIIRSVCEDLSGGHLVTLVGPAGVGKSRIAMAVAGELVQAFPDGVVVVPLGAIASPGDSAEAVQAVRQAIEQSASLVDDLRMALSGGIPENAKLRMLLVIDNAEHLLRAVLEVSRHLLRDFIGLSILVTSRTMMSSLSCQTREVKPLAVHGGSGLPDAVKLFLQCARLVLPALDLTDSLQAVSDLCVELDGMPAAIERAAQLLRAIPLEALMRANPSRQVLGQVSVAELAHQRTLADSLRWSYNLLDEEHRSLLHYLARFPDFFTIDDIDRTPNSADPLPANWPSLLAGLVDSSLVQVYLGPRYSYRLLNFTREFLLLSSPTPRT